MGQTKGAWVHAYLIDAPDGLTLIDALFDADAHRILDQIHQIGRKVTDLKHLVLTHAHRSHLGGLKRLKEMSGARVYAHEWEARIISGETRALHVSWLPKRPFVTYPYQIGLNLGLDKHPITPVDRSLADGDSVGPIHAVHTPGHTPGHLAFYWPERKILFAGDAVVTWPYVMAGWPGFMLDAEQQKVSVRRMAGLEFEVLATGHGEPIVSGGAEQLRDVVNSASSR